MTELSKFLQTWATKSESDPNIPRSAELSRTYNQGCMLAYALDKLGERWTLLIVRDLFLGPRGFVELQTGLGGIGGSLLSKRLKELEEMQLVASEGGEGKRSQYRLTELGEQLRPTVRTMMRWSLRFMRETADEEMLRKLVETAYKPDSLALALEIYADYHREPALSYVARLVIDNHPYTIYYMSGEMTVKRGADTPAMATIETSAETVLAGLRRQIGPDEAKARSKTDGDPKALAHLLECIGAKRKAGKAA